MNSIQFDQETWIKLTPREIEVMKAAASGKTAKEIAATLNMSKRTAEFYRTRIIEKLKAGTIAGAVAQLIRGGII
jgi:DNA-binding CsgD family transcriptional regulator